MKRNLALAMGCIALICSTATANAAEDGLAGWWRFDEGQGRLTADSSGNGNNGQIKGDAAWTAGISGNALKFNGTDTCVTIPHSESLNPHQAMTVCAWIKVSQKPSAGKCLVIADKTRGTLRNNAWDFYWDDRTFSNGMQSLTFVFGNHSEKKYSIMAADAAVTDEDWHFVAAAIDSTVSEYQQNLYVDGRLVTRKTNPAPITGNTLPLMIGTSNTATADAGWFNGVIDDLRIYSRSLAADEILALYKARGEVKR